MPAGLAAAARQLPAAPLHASHKPPFRLCPATGKKNWIRIPAVFYGAFVTATMLPILVELAAHTGAFLSRSRSLLPAHAHKAFCLDLKLTLLDMPLPAAAACHLLLRSAVLPARLCMQAPATVPPSSLPSTLLTCWCPCAWRCTWRSLRSPLAAAGAASPSGTERAQASTGASVLQRRQRIRQQRPAWAGCVLNVSENLHCWLVAWCQTKLDVG